MYAIRKYRSFRHKTEWIILTHSVNLIKNGIYIDPIVLRGNYKYTYGIWQEYFMRDLHMLDLPFHYFVELLDKDYVIYKGCADQKKSTYLEELAKYGIIDFYYKNSILIVLQDNFLHEIPDTRMYDHLNNKLISQLSKTYHLDFSRIKILDECLSKDWETKLKESPLRYTLYPHKYFNEVYYKMSLMKYYKLF